LEESIRKLVGESVHIMSTGVAVAKQLKRQIEPSHFDEQGETFFYTTGDATQVSALASKILQQTIIMQPCQAEASS
jgi:glutamate racemase